MRPILHYDASTRSRVGIFRRFLLRWVLRTGPGLLVCYIGAYAIACGGRGPAANLAYWIYPETVLDEDTLYAGFYPVYWIHTRLLHGDRHSLDRPRLPLDQGS